MYYISRLQYMSVFSSFCLVGAHCCTTSPNFFQGKWSVRTILLAGEGGAFEGPHLGYVVSKGGKPSHLYMSSLSKGT